MERRLQHISNKIKSNKQHKLEFQGRISNPILTFDDIKANGNVENHDQVTDVVRKQIVEPDSEELIQTGNEKHEKKKLLMELQTLRFFENEQVEDGEAAIVLIQKITLFPDVAIYEYCY